MSPTLVADVRALLADYDAAVVVRKGLGVDDDAGKVLVKADVLEWEVDKGGRYEAVIKELDRISNELVKIFAFCPVDYNSSNSISTSLIRS